MSASEEREQLLSQLVDGELSPDQVNGVLTDVFDELAHMLGDDEASRKLHAMLQLRQVLNPWRIQEPVKTIVLPSARPGGVFSSHGRFLSLAAAAVLGGILVTGGFFVGERFRAHPLIAPVASGPVTIITPEQRQEIARAFALHESVAGPLSWYASDDATIQVAPAKKGETLRRPIAVVLRFARDASSAVDEFVPPKTYIIVCRNDGPETIELPASAIAKKLRLRLVSTEINGQISLQYALATNGSGNPEDGAALVGRRCVGDNQTLLGQLAFNNCLVNVDASAWVLGNTTM